MEYDSQNQAPAPGVNAPGTFQIATSPTLSGVLILDTRTGEVLQCYYEGLSYFKVRRFLPSYTELMVDYQMS